VLPNAEGAGYYRFAGDAAQARRLLARGWPALSTRERLATLESAIASFDAGFTAPDALLDTIERAAVDEERELVEMAMNLMAYLLDYLADDASRESARRYARSLFAARLARVGVEPAPGDTGETRLLRASLLRFLALDVRDAAVRRTLAAQGRAYAGVDGPAQPDAVSPDLAGLALVVAVQDGDDAVFETLVQRLPATQDAVERQRILNALGASLDPDAAQRARDLALDASLRTNEIAAIPFAQMEYRELRDGTWRWLRERYPQILARVGVYGASWLPATTEAFCDEARAREVEAFFAQRIDAIEGGPRALASAVEEIHLCAALADAQGPATRRAVAARDARAAPNPAPAR